MSKTDYKKMFEWHGAKFTRESNGQLIGTARFSVKPNKLSVNKETGQWREFQTQDEGNEFTFLARMLELYREDVDDRALRFLVKAKDLPLDELRRWDFGLDNEGRYTLAGKNTKGTVCDIRRFDPGADKWYSTPGCRNQLLGIRRLVKTKTPGTVWICESEWDAIVLRYSLRKGGRAEDIVVSAPGAGTFKSEWKKHFTGWTVYVCYDNDDAGRKGCKKVLEILGDVPAQVWVLQWSDDKSEGYDVRDLWIDCKKKPKAVLRQLRKMLVEAGTGSLDDEATDREDFEEVDPADAPTFEEILAVFRKHLHMTPDLERTLELSLAVTLSAPLPSDPLWLYIVAPPGAGKTVVLDKLDASPKAIVVSTVTPKSLISGQRGDPDPSLLPKLKNRCFVWRDGTELLEMRSDDKDQIYSALRGAYDGRAYKIFGNGVVREYINLRFAMLVAVTPAIHGEYKTSLGERFLKFQIIATRKDSDAQILAAISQVARQDEMNSELRAATGAFLARRVDAKKLPTLPKAYVRRVMALSQLIGLLRAQVDRDAWSHEVKYRPQAELGTRLAKQLVKLAVMLAFVRNKPAVDKDVWRLVERVAFDTAIGFHLEVVQAIMALGGSATRNQIEEKLGLPMTNLQRKLNDLRLLKVLRQEKGSGPLEGRRRLKSDLWGLTKNVRRLWNEAKVEQYHADRPARVRVRHVKKVNASKNRA